MIKKLALVPLLFFAQTAYADMEKAETAASNGDFKTAYEEYLKEADTGNDEAMVYIALMYANGHHVTQDLTKSNEWMLKAANLDNPIAMRNMGIGYQIGVGNLPKDLKKSFDWFMKAANLDEADAQNEVARAYQYGQGTNLNYELALHWYGRAAEQNHLDAQYNLGVMYAEGNGTNKDQQKALEWFEKSAAENYIHSLFTLALLHHNGEFVDQSAAKAADYFKRSFIAGKADATAYLAEYAYTGVGMDKDPVEALKWVTLGTNIRSNIPGGAVTPETLNRLNQNRGFLEGNLTDDQKREAQTRVDQFIKDHLDIDAGSSPQS